MNRPDPFAPRVLPKTSQKTICDALADYAEKMLEDPFILSELRRLNTRANDREARQLQEELMQRLAPVFSALFAPRDDASRDDEE